MGNQRLLSWLCRFAATLSFFGIRWADVMLTTASLETALGLFVFAFVLRHVPEDISETTANERRAVVSVYFRMLGWACWVASAFLFFARYRWRAHSAPDDHVGRDGLRPVRIRLRTPPCPEPAS